MARGGKRLNVFPMLRSSIINLGQHGSLSPFGVMLTIKAPASSCCFNAFLATAKSASLAFLQLTLSTHLTASEIAVDATTSYRI